MFTTDLSETYLVRFQLDNRVICPGKKESCEWELKTDFKPRHSCWSGIKAKFIAKKYRNYRKIMIGKTSQHHETS